MSARLYMTLRKHGYTINDVLMFGARDDAGVFHECPIVDLDNFPDHVRSGDIVVGDGWWAEAIWVESSWMQPGELPGLGRMVLEWEVHRPPTVRPRDVDANGNPVGPTLLETRTRPSWLPSRLRERRG